MLKFGFFLRTNPAGFLDRFTAAANFCCCSMAQLVNKYCAIHFTEPRIKHHISARECHFSCQLLAMSSSPPWPVAYGECDAPNREAQECMHQEKHRGLKEKCFWVCLAVVRILVGQCKGWRLSMAGRKARERISLNESVGLSKTI